VYLVLESLNGAIDQIEKAFPRLFNFIFELMQNAEDVGATKLRIELSGNTLRILNNGLLLNNGRSSNESDVEAVCKVGRSNKTQGDYIGYLGVWFKSVFLLSDTPSVESGGYRSKFDKKHWM
jgi:hypothetical protein